MLPATLTSRQFARLTQYNEEVIRRKCRERKIKHAPQRGREQYRIPVTELEKFGVDLAQANLIFTQPVPLQFAA
jgi:hypothetical protein